MALYVYKKKEVKTQKNPIDRTRLLAPIVLNEEPPIIKTVNNIDYKEEFLEVRRNFYNITIPAVLIVAGLTLLISQLSPYVKHFVVAQFTDKYNQEIISAVPNNYEETRIKYITDPGATYFSDYMSKWSSTHSTSEDDEISSQYAGQFKLSIDKISLKNAPVTANVDSSVEKSYEQALSTGLAHFKGTKIPGTKGNIFIYGHSAAGDYASRNPKDYVISFTNLFKLSLGDEIKITKGDVEYKYSVYKIKEVNPDDTSVLDDQNGNTVTLMTCSPPGLAFKRLIVVARQVN